MMRPQSYLVRGVPWLLAFALLLLAGIVGAAWALPGYASFSQTIPLPPTATPTRAATPALPTATWTPRPTWTRVPTPPPGQPTLTPSPPPPASPTPTPTEAATLKPTLPTPTGGTPIVSPQTPEPTPTATRMPPMALVFEIAVHPQVAGPGDDVYFVLQVANVGYEPVEGVNVSVVWADDLIVRSVDCARCQVGQSPGRLTLGIGRLLPGEQVIAPIGAQVVEDAWPGQLLQTDWTLTAEGMPTQNAQAAVELPWAELPATGAVERLP
ncbi:MAG: hypothetical protein H5T68_12345 [Chloroflexi bacterium]|nr:hypothetical protein [Chloroflexota bacterium]